MSSNLTASAKIIRNEAPSGALLFYPSLFHSTVGSRMSWPADSPRIRLTVAWPADQSIRFFLTQVPARRDEFSRAARRLVHYTGASIAQRIIHIEEVWMRRIDTMSDWQKIKHGVTLLQRSLVCLLKEAGAEDAEQKLVVSDIPLRT